MYKDDDYTRNFMEDRCRFLEVIRKNWNLQEIIRSSVNMRFHISCYWYYSSWFRRCRLHVGTASFIYVCFPELEKCRLRYYWKVDATLCLIAFTETEKVWKLIRNLIHALVMNEKVVIDTVNFKPILYLCIFSPIDVLQPQL